MSRPEVGSGRRRSAMLAGALLLALAGLAPLSAARAFPAQSAPVPADDAAGFADSDRDDPAAAVDDEAGRFPAERGGSYREGTYGAGTYGPEQRAQELYLDGVEKLDAGHRDWAQETFETLIARFPDSAAAGLARVRLGDLYRGPPAAPAAAPVTAPAATLPIARTVAATPPVAQAPATPGRGPVWDLELRRNASIQAKLRGEAGDRIFFSSGSAELGTRARMALAAQAQWLIRWREFEAAVEGHADEPGTDDENIALSRERAEVVRQRLVEEGVEASRVSVVAAGRTQRLATCTSPDCTSQNRRAVTLVFADGTRARLGLAGPATADASSDRARPVAPARAAEIPPAPQQLGPQQAGVTR